MPTREQKATAYKSWQVFFDGKRPVVKKVLTDLAAQCEEKGFSLAGTGSSLTTLCLEDAGFSWCTRPLPL